MPEDYLEQIRDIVQRCEDTDGVLIGTGTALSAITASA